MLKIAGITDIGNKRKVNQDALYIDEEHALFIVADGMGGHQAGDTASWTAIQEIANYLKLEDEEDKTPTNIEINESEHMRKILTMAIETANRKIYTMAQENEDYKGMGTTAAVCQMLDHVAIIAHVGDSRVYLLRDGELTQITKDHSRVQELIDMEKITAEEAKFFPMRNVITRALGGDIDVKVDVTQFPFVSTDVLLLCSDGLSSVLKESIIKEVVIRHAGDPEAACKALVRLTKEAGAPDNVTLILIEGEDFGRDPDVAAPLGEFSLYPEEEEKPIEPTAQKSGIFSSILKKFGIHN